MSRSPRVLFIVTLFAACGDPPADSASADTSASAPTMPTNPSTESTMDTSNLPTDSAGPGYSDTDTFMSEPTSTSFTSTSTSVGETGPDQTGSSGTAPPETSSTGETTSDDTTGDMTTSDDTTGGIEVCECPDIEVPLDDGIFVLSNDAELWKYFPKENMFTMLGELSCGMFDTFSMAVDRQGFAWVQFVGGDLRKVSVSDLTQCDDPGYAQGQMGVNNFGMAFVSNSVSDPCDRIYGNTWNGIPPFSEGPNVGDFITIDPDSLNLTKLGKTNFNGAEVTGTGDGRAYVFGGANPSKLVQLNKNNAMAEEVFPLGGLEINNGAFAFAFFGGDFYFFTDSNNDSFASEVTHLDYDDSDMNGVQDLKKIQNAAPLLIVGAGVSTCAPFAPQ